MQLKKSLGQHFLQNKQIAQKITEELFKQDYPKHIVEIGPGAGVLTDFLAAKEDIQLTLIEFDKRLIQNLEKAYPNAQVIQSDVLKLNWNTLPGDEFAVIGNFPYNISSQIVFKILDHYERVPLMVGMFQKEMAQRIVSPHGSKQFGVISVFSQLRYATKYLFDVDRTQFKPPPAVQSGVIRFDRKAESVDIPYFPIFKRIVKQSFNQRRKVLRNSIKDLVPAEFIQEELFAKRPEQLSLEDFIQLSKRLNAYN